MSDFPLAPPARCSLCGYETSAEDRVRVGAVRGNTARFRDRLFSVWKCPGCLTLHALDPVDLADIYSDYPLNKRKMDVYARGTLKNLLSRLKGAGLSKSASVLDYGCGNGLFVRFLKEAGYTNVAGYDPYVPEWASLPTGRFDCVVANDAIEHCDDVRAFVRACAERVKPGGLLYIGTADSAPVEMTDLAPHVMRLHQPFHRIILTGAMLRSLATEPGLTLIKAWRRSYMDTHMPFANYRFLDELNAALGHNLDLALDPKASTRAFLRSPRLWFFAFFGWFFPSAWEPAALLRAPGT